jgi:hypothetical protein
MLENIYINRNKGFNKLMQDITAQATRKINGKIEKTNMKDLKRKPETKEPVKKKKSPTSSISELSELEFNENNIKKINPTKPANKKKQLKFV